MSAVPALAAQADHHDLHVWVGPRKVATISYEARDDQWALAYDEGWATDAQNAFPLSPVLPLERPLDGYASPSIRRFIEHLLPEGRALDVAVAYNGLSKSNVFGLIRALGAETAGALRFTTEALLAPGADDTVMREVPFAELNRRIEEREQLPLTVWDGKVRMSVAGLQDKLLVFVDGSRVEDGHLFLVEGRRLASTHILKPDTGRAKTPHLAVNEHFCMSLARRMGLPAAEVALLRAPRPILVVRRFDRELTGEGGSASVQRLHIVDACQACDLPVSYKYERHLGSAPELRNYRDGMSFEKLFHCADLTASRTTSRLLLLRWALFQFLIGNTDAHGKNFSFYVQPPRGLLAPTQWYDLVSVLQYDGFDTELAMAYGDVFVYSDVSGFAMADFATRCGVDRRLLRREGQRLAALAIEAVVEQRNADDYLADECVFVQGIAEFVIQQAQRLSTLVDEAAKIRDEYL